MPTNTKIDWNKVPDVSAPASKGAAQSSDIDWNKIPDTAETTPQKKSPSESVSASSSQGLQTGVSQDNREPFIWNGATTNTRVAPVSTQDAVIQTAQAKQAQIAKNAAVMNGNSMTDKNNNAAIAIHTDLADAIDKGQLAPFNNDVVATLNAASDPHGDPSYNGQVMQQRISTLESQKQQALLNKDQAGADKIDVQLAQLRTAYDHIRGLQQINAIYQQQKTQEEAQPAAKPQSQEATTDANSFNPGAPVSVPESTPQQGVDAGSGVTPAVQAGLDYQSQNNLQKLAATQPYDATTIGLEHQALGGNKDAQKDLAKYKTGVPLDPAKKVAYQANGLNILQTAAASAAENNQTDAATKFNSVSDNPDRRLEDDNPQFFKDYHANLIANTRYNKDNNPLYSTLFSEPQISQRDLEQYGKENNLTPEQIAKLKPSDIPTGANWFESAGQGAINAVPFLNTLAPETKKLFIGNTPTDQQSGKGVKGFLSAASSGIGMVGSFMAQTALTGGLLEGAGVLGDVAENAAGYQKLATTIPLAMSNFNNSYEHAKQVIGDDPGDEGKRVLYATTMGTLSTALMSVDPFAKVGQEALGALEKTEGGLGDLLKNKDLADITKQEYQDATERTAEKIMTFSKVTGQHVGTQATIMGSNQIAENLADKLFDPEHPHDVMTNVKDAAIGGAMALILPSIGAGYAAAKANTPLNVATMWEMGNNPEQYKSYIDDHLAKGTMTKEDAITSYQNLNKISQAVEATRNIETPNGEPLTPEQKARYAFSLFQEQKLNEKLESLQAGEKTTNLQPDKAQIDPINSQIKEQQAQRGDILTNAGAKSEQEKPIPAGTQSDEDNPESTNDITKEIQADYFKRNAIKGKLDEGDQFQHNDIGEDTEDYINWQLNYYKPDEASTKYGIQQYKKWEALKNRYTAAKQAEATRNAQGSVATDDETTPAAGNQNISTENLDNNTEPVSLTPQDQSQTKITGHENENGESNRRKDGTENSGQSQDQRGNSEVQGNTEDGRVQGQEESLAGQKPEDNKAGATTPALSVSEKLAALKKKKLVASEDQKPPVIVEPNLKTQDLGEVKGQDEEKTADSVKETTINHPDQPADILVADHPTGESFNEAKDRFKGAVSAIAKDAPDNSVVITHSWGLKLLAAADKLGWDHSNIEEEHQNGSTEPGDLIPYKTEDGKTIWFARHGETTDNVDGLQRTDDTKLTDKGRDQAKSIAQELKDKGVKPATIITSDLPRAKETADIIQKEFSSTKDDGVKNPVRETATALKEKNKQSPGILSKIAEKLGVKSNWDMRGEGDALSGKKGEDGYAQRILSSWNRAKQKGDINTESKISYEVSSNPKQVPYVIAKDENGVTIGEIKASTKNGPNYGKEYSIEHFVVAPEFRGKGIGGELYKRLKELNPNIDLQHTELQSKDFEKFATPQAISEEYHKVKADGSNPELVKSVEEILQQEQPKETPKPNGAIATEADKEQKSPIPKPKPKEKTLTKEQQKVSDDAKLKYNMARKTPSKQGDMIRTATKRIEVLKERINKFSKGSTPYKEAVNELAIKQDFINHTKQYPPKEVGKGYDVKDHMARVARVMKEAHNSESVEEDVMAAMLKMHDHHPETKWNTSSLGNKAVFKANAKPSEITSARNYTNDEGKISIDKWASGMSDDPKKQGEYKEEAERLIREHPSKVDLAKSLEKIQQDRIKAAEDPREAQMKEEWEQQQAREMNEAQFHAGISNEDFENRDEAHPDMQEIQRKGEVIDNTEITPEDEQKIKEYYGKYYNENTGEIDYDKAHMDYNAWDKMKEGLSPKARAEMDDVLPFNNWKEHSQTVQKLITDATEYERQQREAGIPKEGEPERESDIKGGDAQPAHEPENAEEAPNPAGDSEAKLKEPAPDEVAAAEELSEAQRQHAEFDQQLKDKDLELQKERALLQNHIAKGKEAEQKLKIAKKADDKEAVGNLTDVVNNRKDLALKHEANIERLERERSDIEEDQKRKDYWNDLADKVEKKYKDNRDNHEGEALGTPTGLSTKIGDHVMDFLMARAVEGIRNLGNLEVAIRRAIRLTKEKFGDEAKGLSDEDAEGLRSQLASLEKPPKEEPSLPSDHEAWAKDIIDLMRTSDITHEEAKQIVHEHEFTNREGEPVSDHVAENNKAAILNYIDWHNQKDLTSIKNASTRILRKQVGLTDEVASAKKEFGETWDKTKGKIENGEIDPHHLVEALSRKARPLDDVENATLLHYNITQKNKLKEFNEKINKSAEQGDQSAVNEYQISKMRVIDELQKIVGVTKATGAENGRGLATRKMLANDQYELQNMIYEKSASANDGESLNADQLAHIEKLNKHIEETQKAADDYKKQKEAEMQQKEAEFDKKVIELQRQLLKAQQEKARGASSGTADKSNSNRSNLEKSQSKSKAVAARMHKWADDFKKNNKGKTFSTIVPITPEIIADAVHLVATGIEKGGDVLDWVQKAINKAKEDYAGINEATLEKHINQALIDSGAIGSAYENSSKIKELKKAYMTGFFKDGKFDRESERLNVAANRAKSEFDTEIKQDQQKQLSKWAKWQNWFIRFERGMKLTNPLTLGKLSTAALSRQLVTDPLEDVVGHFYSAVLPKSLTKGAIGEGGGVNVKETAAAIAQGWTKGIRDAAQIWSKKSGGKSDLDMLMGKGGDLPPEALDLMGEVHSMIKAPVKRYAFEKALTRRLRNDMANGVDVNNELVQTSIINGALKDANRAIFMQDNTAADWFQKRMREFEKVDPKTGKSPQQWKATLARWMIPFVKVPTNIVAETARGVYGLPVGAGQVLYHTFTKSMEGLSADEKDIIMRNLKKGTIGAAAMTLGYFLPQNFGGYYQQGEKRKDDDAETLGIKIGDTKIPAWFVESPIFQLMQLGATIRRVKDKVVHGQEQGIGEGVWSGLIGLGENVPMIGQPMRILKALDPKERNFFVDELAKSTIDPAILTYVAKVGDPADQRSLGAKMLSPGNERKSPKTMWQHIESGIPGLRENLPEKHPKPVEDDIPHY